MPDPFVVHCHIPKTGGSALNRRVLFPRFGEAQVYQLYRYVFECAERLPLRHTSRAMRSVAAAGHVPYGFFMRAYPKATYVSVFRDPEPRFLSFLNFVLATPGHKIRERLDAQVLDRAGDDPDRFVTAVLEDAHLAMIQSNVQTRLAAGRARLGQHAVTRDDLEAAMFNLAQPNYLAGDQANMGAFEDLLTDRLGPVLQQPRPDEKLEKRLAHRISLEALGPDARARIRAANELDLRLYEVVAGKRAPAITCAA